MTMSTSAAMFLFFAFVAAIAYLIYEHKRVNQPVGSRQPPDVLDMPISASAEPGDMVGPGATANSGWYAAPNANMVP
jgi:hypothetical protein